ncbi:hypothetical protein OSB04_008924 [Centaurea solstitialis]|uniref:F-box domain-containing protein n=1 Tax=Centaurea solstitialis TaxID=347529 RepID=A0AA38WTF7_9ASTR|nr:hypothetical protein OSB04_008924 [Centaurea solstitialis]
MLRAGYGGGTCDVCFDAYYHRMAMAKNGSQDKVTGNNPDSTNIFNVIKDNHVESMENTIIPDDVVRNILSRLSAKPLMRFRCASKHWNSLITDPCFINSRARRMILMPSGLTGLYAFDPKHQNVVKLTYPFEHQIYKCKIIGTLNGIVLLVLEKRLCGPCIFILYNPLTRATKKLFDLPRPCCKREAEGYAYGFCHGNIIIIRLDCLCPSSDERDNCNVFSLEKSALTARKTTFRIGEYGFLVDNVGMLLNGFLHWIKRMYVDYVLIILVLDVTEMVLTRMDGPRISTNGYNLKSSVLGMLHGSLCMSNRWSNGFDVWVKGHSEWSKQYSFALPIYRDGCPNNLDVCILEEGRILVKDGDSNQIIMCHLFERYYDIYKCASEIQAIFRSEVSGRAQFYDVGKPFEYVESLVSPSDMCQSMENTFIPDDVLRNILSRLSAKPLMRFRCASKHWNSLITDPCFINSRSRRMILMPSGLTGLNAFDPKHQDIVKLTYPFEDQIYKCKIIGTLNGIVLLVLENLEKGAWTALKTNFRLCEFGFLVDDVGMFLNGFLHWIQHMYVDYMFIILVLDVTEMVLTRMDGPRISVDCYNLKSSVLGMLRGSLCMSNRWSNGFDVWVKGHSEWSKQYSFALPFYRNGCPNHLDVCILEEGRILVKDGVSNQIIMCHLYERYYDIFKCASEIQAIYRFEYGKRVRYDVGKLFEYVESLVLPSDICHINAFYLPHQSHQRSSLIRPPSDVYPPSPASTPLLQHQASPFTIAPFLFTPPP